MSTSTVISDREAARLAKHWLDLEKKRKEHVTASGLLEKEQEAIEAKIEPYVLATSPKERVVRLAKAVLSVVKKSSTRYIKWKEELTKRTSEAVVAGLEANPPSKDVLVIEPNVETKADAAKRRAA